MKKKIVGLLLILSTVILILSGCSNVKPPVQDTTLNEETEGSFETEEKDEDLKEEKDNIGVLDGVTLYNEEVNNDIFKDNDVTMINIWATFCPPCIQEMPDLGEINREYQETNKKFAIVGICTDVIDMEGKIDEKSLELAKEIVELTGADYTNVLPGKDLISGYLYKVSVVPTTIFVNNEGDILKTVVGAKTKDNWIDIIEKVMVEAKNE